VSHALPPIAKLAQRLLIDIEQAVRGFARYNRYSVGADLRTQAMQVVRVCHRAWRERARQAYWTDQLVWAIDELKLTLQLAKDVHAFRGFAQFEQLIRLAEDLGRQAGGWKRQQHNPKGQSPARHDRAGARPDTEYLRRLYGNEGANP
jgi:hypothetical protein